MGSGASVYQRNLGALTELFNARTGWLIRGGRVSFADEIRTTVNDTLPTNMESLDFDSDEIAIDYDNDIPYAEPYDGPLADDPMADHYLNPEHPRYDEVFDRVFGPEPEPEAAPVDEEMSSSSSWEWFTNTRGGGDQDFDFDWIPDYATESE